MNFKIGKLTRDLAEKVCLSIWQEDGILKIRDGFQPDNTVWAVYKVTDTGTLFWWGQLGGTCLASAQARQMPLEVRDEKDLRNLLKVLGKFALGSM